MELDGKVWLKQEGKNFLGSGKARLLELIDKTGSISKAAKELGMSYGHYSTLLAQEKVDPPDER